ncbi:MAG: bifunctional diaminohydroxyphosphoribosylaminopyrimidine deaminase/5-amino-6-(5-phosphoribosylamino)uracil reductase RibD [Planctomycetes bacterium]|nr:bifunctional diaminohydroxyphosphoribosylaminopyrimidine deaminase/5-amino-6-(5-phosphoribosylamino)uracil reductase RibD [Planctomycetota bacterium]
MTGWTKHDIAFMSEALDLAANGRGLVEPNPMVGCVLVKKGRVVGRGFHHKLGGPHAEVEALRDAGKRAVGASAYVTLEPCNHHGRTPPCTDALIRAGVSRVIAAMKDPNPLVSGKGFRRLRAAGIPCMVGLLESHARALNAPFITRFTKHRPYVYLKWAQSIDGKIATRTGESKWISTIESRRVVHELRARMDAVIVGVATVMADDPDLTARLARPRRAATRVVIDPRLRTPLAARLVRTARRKPTLIATSAARSDSAKARALIARGCDVIAVPMRGRTLRLGALLRTLCDRAMTNVLVEGGGRTLGEFVEQRVADEGLIFVAPRLIGGENAPGPLRNLGPATMDQLPEAEVMAIHSNRGDLCYTIRFASRTR